MRFKKEIEKSRTEAFTLLEEARKKHKKEFKVVEKILKKIWDYNSIKQIIVSNLFNADELQKLRHIISKRHIEDLKKEGVIL